MIRLEEKPFELEGKLYRLRCNMAVLESIEEAHGDMEAVMQLPVRTASLELLRAMLDDYAEEQGWEERWTLPQLKRRVSYAMLMELDLVGMLFRAISPAKQNTPADPGAAEPAEPGN